MERHNREDSRRTRRGRSVTWKLLLAVTLAGALIYWTQGPPVTELAARLTSCAASIYGPDTGTACAGVPGLGSSPSRDASAGSLEARSVTGLVRDASGESASRVVADSAFSDLASATFRPQAVTRHRYLTLSQRCELGLADDSLRCNPKAAHGGSVRDEQEVTPEHEISGRVLTADGLGIPGVTLIASRIGVYAADQRSDPSEPGKESYTRYRAVSKAGGFYSFSDIPDGDYAIRSNKHDNYASVRITVHTDVEFADLVLEEERSYRLEGRVTSSKGRPLGNVKVLPVVVGLPSVRTDRSGHYSLPVSLPPSARNVTLRFRTPGFREAEQSTSLPDIQDGRMPGSTYVELDAVMQPYELETNVVGTVTTEDGEPLSNRVVELRSNAEQRRFQAVTNRKGEYQFPSVPAPMTYRLIVSGAPVYPDYESDVRVDRDDYRFDIVLEPFEFGSLRGHIVDLNGSPIPDLELALRNTASASPSALIDSDRAGAFSVSDAPAGDVVLASQSMPAFVVQGLAIHPGRQSQAEVVLDRGQHELSGTVVDKRGLAVPAARVVLRWSHESDGIKTSTTRRTMTDSQGYFKFDGLGPGPHSIVVDAPGFETVAFDHDVSQDGYNVTVQLN
jgi:protocatechuate 3,4-dioxygenase beta subunit